MLAAQGAAAVVGDAAGLVDPLSGEGIHAAIVSGIAVAAPVEALLGERATSLAAYHDAVETQLGDDLETSYALWQIFQARPEPFVWSLQHVDRVWRQCCRLVRGEIDYHDVPRTFGPIGSRTLRPVAALARRLTASRHPER